MKLSAVVLAKNEEKMITECLKSLSFADEIIVIDDNSTDKTSKLAKMFTQNVFFHPSENFSERREFGLEKASGDWVLYLDADERITGPLKEEILQMIKGNTRYAALFIKRENTYLGEKWPYQDKVERLFRKEKLLGWYGKVHESPKVDGEIGTLVNSLLHITHRDVVSMMAKTIEWSQIEAKLRYNANHPKVTWWRFLRVMFTQFFDYFIRQGGWKNGTEGWVESIYQAFSIFITYARLWEMQKEKK